MFPSPPLLIGPFTPDFETEDFSARKNDHGRCKAVLIGRLNEKGNEICEAGKSLIGNRYWN